MSCSNTEKYRDFCGLLTCPNCGKPLDLGTPTRRCANGHCFDRTAKGGYVHLLRQARRGSSDPGDSAEMCAARTRFLEGGWYLSLRERVAEEAMALRPADVLDAGCGEGWYTSALCEKLTRSRICGIDLSKYALRHAGRTCPRAEFAVASIFELPLADASVDLVTHLFAPMADKEFCRVLRPGGQLILGAMCYPAAVNAIAGILNSENEEARSFQRADMTEMLDECGFEKITWQRTGFGTGVMIAWKRKPNVDEMLNAG